MSTICDDLRKSILRAAITGRLTEQLDSDAPVKKVLDANNILHDNEKEYHFDIPENWAWVKLKAVANIQYGFSFNSQLFNKNEKGMPLIRIRDILPAKTSTYTTEKAPESYLIKKNDMLVGMDGNFNVNFWNSEDAYLNQRCCKIAAGLYLEQKLLYWFLQIFLDEIFENVSYTTVKHLSDRHLTKMSIPLPPLAEQKRIVEKVDELMARVADLEQSADALASLKKAFPDDIKASLLQAAMQGKLTKQLPEDGSAEDLLEEIKAEKEKLIAEGKIGKQKAPEPITASEVLFEIPKNWRFSRIGNIFEIINGAAFKPSDWSNSGTKIVRIQNLNNPNAPYNLTKKDVDESIRLHGGELLFAWSGTPGTSFGAHIWNGGEAVLNQHIFLLKFNKDCFDIGYLRFALNNTLSGLIAKAHGSAGLQHVTRQMFEKTILPIPPLAEQKRIVECLDALMQNINVVGDLIASE